MTTKQWIRQTHRLVSMVFVIVSGAIFMALALGHIPASWVYALPLFPLALLVISGMYLFFLPYVAGRHEQQARRAKSGRLS